MRAAFGMLALRAFASRNACSSVAYGCALGFPSPYVPGAKCDG